MSRSVFQHCGDSAADAAAYVLCALDPDEAVAFERHLATCVVCRDEVDAFSQVTDALALSAPEVQAPARLRRAVHRELRHARSERSAFVPPPPARWPAGTRWQLRLRPAGARPALGLAGALAAVVVAVSATGGLTPTRAGAPGRGRTIQARVVGVPGSAEVRLGPGHAELVVRHFPAPASGEIYEVWLERRDGGPPQPTSALFSVTSNGQGVVEVPGNLRRVSTVLVTQEPAGGSRRPTSAPVIVARLS